MCKQTFNDWFQTQLGSYFLQGVISKFSSKTGIISNYFDTVTLLHNSSSNVLDGKTSAAAVVSATDNAHRDWQALKLEIA